MLWVMVGSTAWAARGRRNEDVLWALGRVWSKEITETRKGGEINLGYCMG